MKNPFIDKNDDWEIIKAVRLDLKKPEQGVRELFDLILSGHGQVGVLDGKIVYIPSKDYHIHYMRSSSSVIRMTDGNGEPMSNEMKLALLEDWQYWENEVLSFNISKINKALSNVSYNERMIYLDGRINTVKYKDILYKYNLSKRKYYKLVGKVDKFIIHEFKLYSNKQEEKAIEYIIETLKKYDKTTDKTNCQDFIEKSSTRRKLIQTLYSVG
ncbi:hypothetical protein G7059_00125 [Erysipelothrix sp. HDW6A]|uniref:hypothetical protein n=1 Tax=Erysipelothrix sp. HDW6A TaxID=2714928 RepID=UPI00140D8B21|nr:hypothetical protein [Erysipelothrix sp. HDW6A]QIK56361.1 hypothetical protein G7059_00125 [Erysipelothrix sp. HDW6A]